MNVLLINPIARSWSKPNCFPSGLGYIASVLRNNDHHIDVLDFNAIRQEDITYEGWITSKGKKDYDWIGITGIITQYKDVKKIAKICRDYFGNVFIICGGPLATSVPDLLLNNTEVDKCVIGEGEEVIFDLMDDIFDKINLNHRKYFFVTTIKNLDTIPMPAYDLFPTSVYCNNPIAYLNTRKWVDGSIAIHELRPHIRSMNIIGSRGCPYNCIYCYHNYMGCGYRVRGAKAIVEEMKYLAQNYNVEYIHFGDDCFAFSVKKMKEFCEEIFAMQFRSDFKWNMTWSCAGRANVMNKDMASMMKDAGCVGVCYGFESGSQEMLDVMNKHVILDNYRRSVEISKEYFVYEDYTFMINMFGETDETVQESIDFCKEVDIVPSAVFFTTVYPGTKMFEMLVKQGKIFPNDYAWMEKYILCLDEQGEDMKWSDMLWWSKYSVDHVKQWHKELIGKTNAWNKEKHV